MTKIQEFNHLLRNEKKANGRTPPKKFNRKTLPPKQPFVISPYELLMNTSKT